MALLRKESGSVVIHVLSKLQSGVLGVSSSPLSRRWGLPDNEGLVRPEVVVCHAASRLELINGQSCHVVWTTYPQGRWVIWLARRLKLLQGGVAEDGSAANAGAGWRHNLSFINSPGKALYCCKALAAYIHAMSAQTMKSGVHVGLDTPEE